MMARKKELLLKLKELADRGVGGERHNAQKMLNELLVKYEMSESDLSSEDLSFHEIAVPNKHFAGKILAQVCYSIHGDINPDKGLYNGLRRGRVRIKCTNAEFIEITAKYNFYLTHFENDLKTFYSAFIQRNQIFPPKSLEKDSVSDYKLTADDYKMLEIAGALDKHHFVRQLEGK